MRTYFHLKIKNLFKNVIALERLERQCVNIWCYIFVATVLHSIWIHLLKCMTILLSVIIGYMMKKYFQKVVWRFTYFHSDLGELDYIMTALFFRSVILKTMLSEKSFWKTTGSHIVFTEDSKIWSENRSGLNICTPIETLQQGTPVFNV